MAGFSVNTFGGQVPKLSSRLLKENLAQSSRNCELLNGDLVPTRALGPTTDTLSAAPGTLTSYTDPSAYLFDGYLSAGHETEFIIRPLPNDQYDRIYYVDASGQLRVSTHSSLTTTGSIKTITSGADHAAAVSPPATRPTTSASGGSSSINIEVAYVITYVDQYGAEGPPSTASVPLTCKTDDTVTVTNAAGFINDEGITKFRVYRAVSGSAATRYQYVGESPIGTPGFSDTSLPDWGGADAWGDDGRKTTPQEVVVSDTWYPAPTDLDGCISAGQGVLIAWRGNTLYFSETFLPHAWPPNYQIVIESDIVGLASIGGAVVVLTNSIPYLVGGNLPSAPSVQRLDTEEACLSRKGITTLGNTCLYASPNGIVAIGMGEMTNITDAFLDRQQWEKMNPSDCRLGVYNDDILMFYQNATSTDVDFDLPTNGVMQIRTGSAEGFIMFHDDDVAQYVVRPHDERLFIITGSGNTWYLKEWNPTLENGGVLRDYIWKSKQFRVPRDICMSALQVDAEAYPINLRLWLDGALVHFQTISSDEPFRLPPGRAKQYEIELSGQHTVRSWVMGQSIQDIQSDATA